MWRINIMVTILKDKFNYKSKYGHSQNATIIFLFPTCSLYHLSRLCSKYALKTIVTVVCGYFKSIFCIVLIIWNFQFCGSKMGIYYIIYIFAKIFIFNYKLYIILRKYTKYLVVTNLRYTNILFIVFQLSVYLVKK